MMNLQRRQVAYLTDSGAGAIVVVDLAAGTGRRLLAGHPSTRSEEITLTIGGKPCHAITPAAPDAPVLVTAFADSRKLASISSHEAKN
jgi:hypothetical protein